MIVYFIFKTEQFNIWYRSVVGPSNFKTQRTFNLNWTSYRPNDEVQNGRSERLKAENLKHINFRTFGPFILNLSQHHNWIEPLSSRRTLVIKLFSEILKNGANQLACNYLQITNWPTLNIIPNFLLFHQITVNNIQGILPIKKSYPENFCYQNKPRWYLEFNWIEFMRMDFWWRFWFLWLLWRFWSFGWFWDFRRFNFLWTFCFLWRLQTHLLLRL